MLEHTEIRLSISKIKKYILLPACFPLVLLPVHHLLLKLPKSRAALINNKHNTHDLTECIFLTPAVLSHHTTLGLQCTTCC